MRQSGQTAKNRASVNHTAMARRMRSIASNLASFLTYILAYVLTFLLAFYLASDILSGAWLRFGSAHWDLQLTVETLTWQVEKIIPESNCSKIRTGWLGSSLQLALGLGKTLCLHVFASWIPALDVWSSICDGLSLVESNIFFVHYPIVWLNLQLQTPIFLKL